MEAVGEMAGSELDLEAILACVSPEPIFNGDYTPATIQKLRRIKKK
jgi:hypothetical protein